MFIELVASIRCLRPHEDSWLVASAGRMEERHIIEGVLGCPICGTEYPIADSVTYMGTAASPGALLPPPAATPDVPAGEAEVMRLAALLDLADPGGMVVLVGAWGREAIVDALAELVRASWLLVNAPAEQRQPRSALRVEGALPLAEGCARAIALDDAHAIPGMLAGAAHALRPRGRLVAPASASLPDGVRELARDAHQWVAERVPEPPRVVTTLERRRS